MINESLTFAAALLLGFGFGMGPCNVSCLPFLGPVFLAQGGGVRRAWRVVVPFSLGRLTGYGLLGAVAGYFGESVAPWLERGGGRWLLAGAAVAVGVILFRRAGRGSCAAPAPGAGSGHGADAAVVRAPRRAPLPGALFLMGVGMALNPCAPLGMVLVAAATTASAPAGLLLGGGFGIGAVIVPALLFGVGMAYMGQEIRAHLTRWRRPLERGAALLLVVMGGVSALGGLHI